MSILSNIVDGSGPQSFDVLSTLIKHVNDSNAIKAICTRLKLINSDRFQQQSFTFSSRIAQMLKDPSTAGLAAVKSFGTQLSGPEAASALYEALLKARTSKDAELIIATIQRLDGISAEELREWRYKCLTAVQDTQISAEAKKGIIREIGQKFNEERIRCLILQLIANETDDEVRAEAIRLLVRSREHFDLIRGFLNHQSQLIRVSAASVIAQFGEPTVFPLLIEPFETRTADSIPSWLFRSIAALGDRRAVPYLVEGLKAADPAIKREIISALVLIGDKKAIPHLKALLNDDRRFVRYMAGIALGHLKSKAALKILREMLGKKEEKYVIPALKSLAVLQRKKALETFLVWADHSVKEISVLAGSLILSLFKNELVFIAQNYDLSGVRNQNSCDSILVSLKERLSYYRDEHSRPNPKRIDLNSVCLLMSRFGCGEATCEVSDKIKELENDRTSLCEYGEFMELQTDDSEGNYVTADDSSDGEISMPVIKRYATQRPNQLIFRENVINRYGAFCAVCGIQIPELLEAAHIITKSSRGKDDPRNGLVLCCLHHKAYDSGLFAIEPITLKVHYKRKGPDFDKLRIKYEGIDHLHKRPHTSVLQWRWEKWLEQQEHEDGNLKAKIKSRR